MEAVEAHESTRCFRGSNGRKIVEALQGERLVGSRVHGKRMLFEFSDGLWLGLHLGMTGKLLVRENGEARERHDHFAMRTSAGWLVFNDPRQFGKVELFESESVPAFWVDLPREVLSEEFDYTFYKSILERRKRAVLKSLLLVQELFPGVGNWMADEILWRARIRPDRRVSSLEESERVALFNALKFVCRGAMKYIAPDFSDPPKSWLFRHRWRAGGHCPRSGVALERDDVGGRTTCWCGECQF